MVLFSVKDELTIFPQVVRINFTFGRDEMSRFPALLGAHSVEIAGGKAPCEGSSESFVVFMVAGNLVRVGQLLLFNLLRLKNGSFWLNSPFASKGS